jgi:hypothetical protein
MDIQLLTRLELSGYPFYVYSQQGTSVGAQALGHRATNMGLA